MMNLSGIARALGGKVVSGAVSCPGPGHSKHDTSLRVFLDLQAPCGFRIHSLAQDDMGICWDHVKARLGIVDERGRNIQSRPERRAPAPEPDDSKRTATAIAIWREARSIEGTVGLTYLGKRGVELSALPPDLHLALRWHPTCPWETGRQGCMVALFTDVVTGQARAIHRTGITPAGEKIGRKVLGPMAGCVIRLWPDEVVTDGLVLGEGIETTLGAATRIQHRGTSLRPAWATASAGSMAKFPVLAGIEALTLLVDNDASGTGQKSADECSARWTAAGHAVIRLVPKSVGVDFNDIAMERSNG